MLRALLLSVLGLTASGDASHPPSVSITFTADVQPVAVVEAEIEQLGGVALVEIYAPERASYLVTGDGGAVVTVLDDRVSLRALPGSLAYRVDTPFPVAMAEAPKEMTNALVLSP